MNQFKFEFTEQEANIIAKALSTLPYYEAVSVISKLQEQYAKAKQSKPEISEVKTEVKNEE